VQSNASLLDPENTSRRLLEKIGVDSIPIDVHGIEKVWKGLTIVEEEIDGPGYLLPLGKIGAEIIVRGQIQLSGSGLQLPTKLATGF
jgi:hypothetical protein